MASEFIQATPLVVTEAYYDLGTFSRKVSTNSVDAQVWFDRGLIWTYSFNHEEAANCFQQVIAHDPNCAMGYWGVAFVAGPNYNKKWAVFDEHDLKNSVRKGYHAIRVAEEHMISTMPFERALIKALRHRFPADTVVQDFGAVDKAYSDAMRGVYWNFGETDMDVIALFADALMNTNPWGMYEESTGKPILSTPVLEVKKVLEDGLAFPMAKEHPGILHMYIHLMEMSATPEVALVPADHLRDLVPDAGHLRHMPTHLDILVGDYRRSIDCNMKATFADDKFYERRGGNNFYSFYRLHNYHSLIYACMLAGQSGIALESIDRMETTITEDMLRIESPPMADWLEFFVSVRVHVLIRFGLWEELKKLAIPEDKELYCVTVVMSHYGKAIAWAATGYLEEADKERGLFHAAAKHVPPTRMDFLNRVVDEVKIVASMLDGELEYRRGNYRAAFASLRQATLEEDNLHYSEPGWMLPSRHAYAALLLEQDHVVEAAEIYAEDMGLSHKLIGPHRHPNNVWALHGYHECMTRLGRTTEAQMIQVPLKVAMAVADIPIQSSCFCRLGTANKQCSKEE